MNRALRIAGLVETLRAHGHGSALVGGLAVSVRARERFTKDVDLAVATASDAESEALAFAMQREGLELTTVIEQESKGVVATLRFRSHSGFPDVDLLCASSGIEPEIVAAARPIEIARGILVPVATTAHLIATKVLAIDEARDQDASDLRALLSIATPAEVRAAEDALRLIADRTFSRGKDLPAELDGFLDRLR